jgi:propionate CoA-transferase
MASPDQFTYFQGGGFDRTYLSFLEVDAEGNVNVSRLASRPHVTAGAGGFIDITARARAITFCGYFTAGGLDQDIHDGQLVIRKEGKNRKFVQQVEHVTFSGKRAREQKQQVLFVTERAVLRLEPEGLTVIEIAPGIELKRDVLEQANTELKVSPSLKVMDRRLFEPGKMGMRLQPRQQE